MSSQQIWQADAIDMASSLGLPLTQPGPCYIPPDSAFQAYSGSSASSASESSSASAPVADLQFPLPDSSVSAGPSAYAANSTQTVVASSRPLVLPQHASSSSVSAMPDSKYSASFHTTSTGTALDSKEPAAGLRMLAAAAPSASASSVGSGSFTSDALHVMDLPPSSNVLIHNGCRLFPEAIHDYLDKVEYAELQNVRFEHTDSWMPPAFVDDGTTHSNTVLEAHLPLPSMLQLKEAQVASVAATSTSSSSSSSALSVSVSPTVAQAPAFAFVLPLLADYEPVTFDALTGTPLEEVKTDRLFDNVAALLRVAQPFCSKTYIHEQHQHLLTALCFMLMALALGCMGKKIKESYLDGIEYVAEFHTTNSTTKSYGSNTPKGKEAKKQGKKRKKEDARASSSASEAEKYPVTRADEESLMLDNDEPVAKKSVTGLAAATRTAVATSKRYHSNYGGAEHKRLTFAQMISTCAKKCLSTAAEDLTYGMLDAAMDLHTFLFNGAKHRHPTLFNGVERIPRNQWAPSYVAGALFTLLYIDTSRPRAEERVRQNAGSKGTRGKFLQEEFSRMVFDKSAKSKEEDDSTGSTVQMRHYARGQPAIYTHLHMDRVLRLFVNQDLRAPSATSPPETLLSKLDVIKDENFYSTAIWLLASRPRLRVTGQGYRFREGLTTFLNGKAFTKTTEECAIRSTFLGYCRKLHESIPGMRSFVMSRELTGVFMSERCAMPSPCLDAFSTLLAVYVDSPLLEARCLEEVWATIPRIYDNFPFHFHADEGRFRDYVKLTRRGSPLARSMKGLLHKEDAVLAFFALRQVIKPLALIHLLLCRLFCGKTPDFESYSTYASECTGDRFAENMQWNLLKDNNDFAKDFLDSYAVPNDCDSVYAIELDLRKRLPGCRSLDCVYYLGLRRAASPILKATHRTTPEDAIDKTDKLTNYLRRRFKADLPVFIVHLKDARYLEPERFEMRKRILLSALRLAETFRQVSPEAWALVHRKHFHALPYLFGGLSPGLMKGFSAYSCSNEFQPKSSSFKQMKTQRGADYSSEFTLSDDMITLDQISEFASLLADNLKFSEDEENVLRVCLGLSEAKGWSFLDLVEQAEARISVSMIRLYFRAFARLNPPPMSATSIPNSRDLVLLKI